MTLRGSAWTAFNSGTCALTLLFYLFDVGHREEPAMGGKEARRPIPSLHHPPPESSRGEQAIECLGKKHKFIDRDLCATEAAFLG
jgi:hypothetical protein